MEPENPLTTAFFFPLPLIGKTPAVSVCEIEQDVFLFDVRRRVEDKKGFTCYGLLHHP
jgi:hypothetical protein